MMRQELGQGVWYSPENSGYIMLDVTEDIPDQASHTIDGVDLTPKGEYHCSLAAANKLANGDLELETAIVNDVASYLVDNKIEFSGLTGDYLLCSKEKSSGEIEYTIIRSAEVVGLDGLRRIIAQHVPGYEPPLLHVTLLKSANSKYGIGINSDDDIKAYCRKLDNY